MLVIGMSAIAVDTQAIEGRQPHINCEIAVRPAADGRRAFELEANFVRDRCGLIEEEIDKPVAREWRPRDLTCYRSLDAHP